jgi:hypothetical protein
MRMDRFLILFAALLGLVPTASAEVEKFARTECAQAVCLYWWPKLPALSGWHHEKEPSVENTSNILAPDGSDFANAEAIIYARAFYKPQSPSTSVADLMARDRKDTAKALPGTVIADAPALTNGDGKTIKTQTFYPPAPGKGSWERLAYDDEGDFYLMFTISANSKAGLEASMKDFERLIAAYKAKP